MTLRLLLSGQNILKKRKRGKIMKTLKRTFSIVLALMMVIGLAACSEINVTVNCDEALLQAFSGNGSSAPTQAPATQTPTEAPATQAPAEDTTAAPSGSDDTTAAPAEDTTAAPSGELSASSSLEDVVAKYAEVYEKTKATGTFTGKSKTVCTAIAIDGKQNSLVKSIADAAIGSEGDGTTPLSPSRDDNPGLECAVKPSDIQDYKYTDNGDGTATIRLEVKPTENSRRFQDPAGDMLDVMEDLKGTLSSVSALSWAEGDADSNVILTSSGYCEVTYDKSTDMMTKAEYVLYTEADVQHANVAIFRDKNATASFEYTIVYPGK